MRNTQRDTANQSSLRSQLRTRSRTDEYLYCEVVCAWVTGSVQPRYQFQAKITTRPSRLRTAAYSPTFAATEPIGETAEARDALTALTSRLLADGWEAVDGAPMKHWYSRSFRRKRTDPIERSSRTMP